jgi:hypothetical protein
MNGVITLVLVGTGCGLIALGAYMTHREWNSKHKLEKRTEEHMDKTLGALTKLVIALKDYPAGQQLIVWGIVVLIIAGLFSGVSALAK